MGGGVVAVVPARNEAEPSATWTQADDISVNVVVVGVYIDSIVDAFHGFKVAGGNFTILDFPGAITSVARGINATGQIVGDYYSGLPKPSVRAH